MNTVVKVWILFHIPCHIQFTFEEFSFESYMEFIWWLLHMHFKSSKFLCTYVHVHEYVRMNEFYYLSFMKVGEVVGGNNAGKGKQNFGVYRNKEEGRWYYQENEKRRVCCISTKCSSLLNFKQSIFKTIYEYIYILKTIYEYIYSFWITAMKHSKNRTVNLPESYFQVSITLEIDKASYYPVKLTSFYKRNAEINSLWHWTRLLHCFGLYFIWECISIWNMYWSLMLI